MQESPNYSLQTQVHTPVLLSFSIQKAEYRWRFYMHLIKRVWMTHTTCHV